MTELVEALIQAAGSGERLGGQPKAFVSLGRETVLERTVRVMLEVADHVIAAVPSDALDRARALVDDPRLDIVAGGTRRTDTTRLLVDLATAPWLILHDAAHPLVDVRLARRVLAAARTHGAAIATLPVTEYVYDVNGRQRRLPGQLVTTQKPVACRRESMVEAFRIVDRPSIGEEGDRAELSSVGLLALAGVTTHFIPGDPRNLKLTYEHDLELLRVVAAASDPPQS